MGADTGVCVINLGKFFRQAVRARGLLRSTSGHIKEEGNNSGGGRCYFSSVEELSEIITIYIFYIYMHVCMYMHMHIFHMEIIKE